MLGTTSAPVQVRAPKAIHIDIKDDTLSVDLDDGRTIAGPISWYPRLAAGTPAERANFTISGAGFGIHWPDVDEDIGEGLLLGKNLLKVLHHLGAGLNNVRQEIVSVHRR